MRLLFLMALLLTSLRANSTEIPKHVRDERLFNAVTAHNIEQTRYLLALGANVNSRHTSMEFTPLMIASSIEIINLLLEKGADVNARDARGWPVIIIAAISFKQHPDIIEHLLKKGADQNLQLTHDSEHLKKGMNLIQALDQMLATNDNEYWHTIKKIARAKNNNGKDKPLTKPKISPSSTDEKKNKRELLEGISKITNPIILLKKSGDIRGLALELSPSMQTPLAISSTHEKLFLEKPEIFVAHQSFIEDPKNSTFADLEKRTHNDEHLFQFFHECPCISRAIRQAYTDQMITLMGQLYKTHPKDTPFVYTSFNAHNLFHDLYLLTKFIIHLKKQGATTINLVVNLIDPTFKQYINTIKSLPDDIIHFRPRLTERMLKRINEESMLRLNYSLHQFLRWLMHNLSAKIQLNLYYSGNAYAQDVYDHKVPASDVISAIDYSPEQQSNIATLLAGTLKKLNEKETVLINTINVHGIFGSLIGQPFKIDIAEGEEEEKESADDIQDTAHVVTMAIALKKEDIPIETIKSLGFIFKDKMPRLFYPLMHTTTDAWRTFEYNNSMKQLKKARIDFDITNFFDIKLIKKFKISNGANHQLP